MKEGRKEGTKEGMNKGRNEQRNEQKGRKERRNKTLTLISLKYKLSFGKSPETVMLGHLGSAVNINRLKIIGDNFSKLNSCFTICFYCFKNFTFQVEERL